MNYNPNPFAGQQSPYHMPQQPPQQQQQPRGNGIIFVHGRDPKSQHFLSLFQSNPQSRMFQIVDIAVHPHKFVPSVRQRCGGRVPAVVVRGMQKILVDNDAFAWLASQQQQQQGPQPPQGGQPGGGGLTGYDGGFGTPGMPAGQSVGDAESQVAAVAAASSLDAMYGGLLSQDMQQQAASLESGGGRGGLSGGGKLTDNVLDQYLQQRAQDVPMPHRPM